MNSTKYHDSNCELCIHKKVCSLRAEYIDYVTNLRKYGDSKLDKFGISIICSFFREEQPTQRAPIV